MARVQRSHGFTALKIEGGILPPEFIESVASLEAPHQKGADYGLSKSLVVKEELARYWRIANDLYGRYTERRYRHDLGIQKVGVDEWLIPFLRELLGYDDLTATESTVLADRVFKLTHRACGGAVPLLLVTNDYDLDRADPRLGEEGRRHAAQNVMQEYLNAETRSMWGMVSNGSKLRILRDNASLTRPSYIEADLDLVFREELYPDFAAFWLATHASRLRPANDKPSSCIIESWRGKALETGSRVREHLRVGVTNTLRQFGNGFIRHANNVKLRKAIECGELTPEQYFLQLLRLVYRLLFLFTAEERDLLHAPNATNEERAVFAEGYSLSRLRERARWGRHFDRNWDLWQGLQVTFHTLAQGASGLGLRPLGGLFRDDQCPDLDEASIANEDLLAGLRTLAFFPSGGQLRRVNYRDMDTEELGSVYESLLELRPFIDVDASPWTFAFTSDSNGARTKGSKRKLTGSYYTPPTLVNELIKSTLDPVIAEAVASCPEDPRGAILALKVLDPACGSGHFLLAAARRLAAEIARIDSGDDTINEIERQAGLREVVQHCIYGVDRNPLAVELCKTALWVETVEPGKPLTFLDSHILIGNSLIGLSHPEIMANGIPSAAYERLTGDDKEVAQHLKKRNQQPEERELFDQEAVQEVATASLYLDAMPEDSLDEVERKRTTWEATLHDPTHSRETYRANLFIAAYFAVKNHEFRDVAPQTQDIERLIQDQPQRNGVEGFVKKLADMHHFLHWHLSFSEIVQNGGFDVVLGNPPWERIKLQEQEFFASKSPVIAAAPNKAARDRLIRRLNGKDALPVEKNLYLEFIEAKRETEAASQFVRTGGRFPLTGVGDVNTYAVFAETFLQLVKPTGRAGLIVPTGIATDHSTKAFFEHIVSARRLVSLFDFENREALFADVHRSYKFCLLTLCGNANPATAPEFAFFLRQTEQLKEDDRRFSLTVDDFTLFNPNTRTCPIFRTKRDMEIARKIYLRSGVFWKESRGSQREENPWGAKFSRMFDMSNDSSLFRTHAELTENGWQLQGNEFVRKDERCLPLYEAKLFHQYDHRFATFEGVSEQDRRKGKARPVTLKEKSDPNFVVMPRYWIAEEEVLKRLDKRESISQLAQHSTAQHSTAQHSTAQHSTAQHSTAQHSTAQHSTAQHSTAQHSTAQHSTAQHSTAQHSTAQHSTAQQLETLAELARSSLSEKLLKRPTREQAYSR